MANIDNELREMCLSEAKWLESLFEPAADDEDADEDEFDEDADEREDDEKSPFELLEESVYDLRYTIDAQGRYLGVQLLLAGGGPTIWFDSFREMVIGDWSWSGHCEIRVYGDALTQIDEYFEEMWNCIR